MKAASMKEKERDLLACHVKEVLEEMHPSHYIVFFARQTSDKKRKSILHVKRSGDTESKTTGRRRRRREDRK